MKKFRFTLRSVQTVRNIRELRAREAFSAAVVARAAAADKLSACQLRLRELEQIMISERSVLYRAADQVAFIHEQERLQQASHLATQELAKAEEHLARMREQWISSRRDVRVIENLETKARERHRMDCEHEEQAAMDDRASTRVGRAPLITS